MKYASILLASAGAFSLAAAAQATTIDFSGHTSGTPIGNTYAAEGVIFSGADFQQCGGGCPAPTPNGFFAYSNDGSNSFTADFATPQTSISFQDVTYSSTLASAYNGAMLVATVADNESNPVSNSVNVLSGATPFTSVVFTFNGGYNGPAITNLTFTSGPVPEPASWALMLTGFGLVGYALRRRARATAAYA